MDKKNIRVFFEKKGRAVYISHLDLVRTMQRALKRSGLPVWYTEGFNPRIYLNFPLALSLGVEGVCEPADMALTEDVSFEEIQSRLNAVIPGGLKITGAAYPVFKNSEIGFAEYSVLYGNDCSDAFSDFIAQDSIEVLKHSKKRGQISVDIKPHVTVTEIKIAGNGMSIDFRLPAGNDFNLNAGIFTEAFADFCDKREILCELICTKRTNILCKSGERFA